MAVKNGASFLEEQLLSILPQLEANDEVVVCDDHSTDCSRELLREFDDPRIRLLSSSARGLTACFEQSLAHSMGDFIFLADQDDIWSPRKIATMRAHLTTNDLVVCDCALVNEKMEIEQKSFFEFNGSGAGLVKNLIRNSYMGCCMAFRRSLLEKALPFPKNIPIHDYWIGLVAELHFKTLFIDEPLVWHRRHRANASTTGRRSQLPYSKRLSSRYHLLKNLVKTIHD